MRKIVRRTLPRRVLGYLNRKQAQVNHGEDVQRTWQNARQTRAVGKVAETLREMSGLRERCMFCEDSRGTDIEHFWPKAPYKEKAFVWENMLWACAGCNRMKGNRFGLDEKQAPLLIDPTSEDPWDFLYFDPHTGNITARIDPRTGAANRKGQHTTEPTILPLNIEPITDGRQRVYRRLRRAVTRFLDHTSTGGVRPETISELLDEIRDNTDYGLANWFFLKDGSDAAPFSELCSRFPHVWNEVVQLVA